MNSKDSNNHKNIKGEILRSSMNYNPVQQKNGTKHIAIGCLFHDILISYGNGGCSKRTDECGHGRCSLTGDLEA
jgi:hypothetical protein